ncbi:putative Ig domain-containing protein [Dactylosporangium matsuzakiense]|uniref:DUF1023 domain-containing protein n=1 Tax=Dactylosporangium matsuzakiense TaxID=53360 RepID=A0A9W6NLP7_9ACTN|nr:putative Ig domain-containing protein [Dactylosporangium matsuzakiense]GLL02185.1 hypothetical protein GCM10017581_039270 [Dactylosporangium matsuzakiense]
MATSLRPSQSRRLWYAFIVVALTVVAGGVTGTALAAATPPALTSPGNQTSAAGTAVSLSVARTGGTSPFTWTATGLPAGLTINATTGAVSGTPTTVGATTTKITVTDAAKATTNVSFTWTVVIGVSNPGPQAATVGVAVNLAMARTGGTSPFTWSATGLPAGLAIAASTGLVTGKPTAAGTATSTVKVTDSAGRTGTATVAWTVTTPPAVTNPGNRTITIGVPASLTVAATGGTAPYTWTATGLPAGLTMSAATGVVSGTPTTAGSSTSTVTVTDATARTATASFTWSSGPAPVVANPGNRTLTVGTAASLTVTASGGTAPYTWAATGLPAGLTIAAATGLISGTPTTAGAYAPVVTATDAAGRTGTVTFSAAVGTPVAVINPGAQAATVGATTSLTVAATGGIASYTWAATGLPAGLTINATTGLVSGTPTAAGTVTATITATDAAGRTGTASVAWTTATAVTLANPGPRTATVGTAYNLQLSAAGGAGAYTFTATGLPAGLTIAAATGLISGTPTATATSTVTVTVTDAGQRTASTTFTVAAGVAPTVTSPGNRTTTIGVATSVAASAAGGVTPYTWSGTGLPAGLTVDGSTGTISGTPTATGVAAVTLAATDAAGRTGRVTFTLTVGLAVANPGTLAGTTGVGTQLTLSGTGGTLPYTWTATGLPAGLSIVGGAITGTPTTAATSTVKVTATDAAGLTGSATFTWTVAAPVVVTNPNAQAGTVGVAASLTVAATGGVKPYAWTAAGLPAGLAINATTGAVTGTPTTAGTVTVTVTATDAGGRTGSASFGWTVGAAPIVADPGAQAGTIGVQSSVAFTASSGAAPYTWSATGLPTGLSINATTGVVSGKPTKGASTSAKITATDAAKRTGSVTVAWTVTTPVVIDNVWGTISVTGSEPSSVALTATGGAGGYRWAATGLPAGLTLNASTGVVEGMVEEPSSEDTAYYPGVTVTATDAAGRVGTTQYQVSVSRRVMVSPSLSTQMVIASATLGTGETLQVIDQTAGDRLVGSCTVASVAATGSCSPHVNYKAEGTHTFVARITRADGTVRAASLPQAGTFTAFDSTKQLTVTHFLSYPDAGAAQSVGITAMVKGAADLVSSPYYLEIEDYTTHTVVASCAAGWYCDATVPAALAGHDFWAVLTTYDVYPTGGRTWAWPKSYIGKIDFSAAAVTLEPYTYGDGNWGFNVWSNRYDRTVTMPGRYGGGGFVVTDTTTGVAVGIGTTAGTVCGSTYDTPARVIYDNLGPSDEPNSPYWQIKSVLKAPVWYCNWTVKGDSLDPTHEFVASATNNAQNRCFSVLDCGTPIYSSPAWSLAAGAEWLDTHGYWRGGLNPVVPPRTVDPADIPAYGTSASAVSSWWRGLNTIQQSPLAFTYPERIGELDGIPVVIRDAANQIVMDRERTRLATRAAQLEAEYQHIQQLRDQNRLMELFPQAPSYSDAVTEAEQEQLRLDVDSKAVLKQIDGIDAVKQRLADHTVPAYLVSFSETRGNGRAVVAINNPDTAENVVTYVPGTYAAFDGGFKGDIERSDKMVADALAIAPGKRTSSISWLGYDAPQSILPGAAQERWAVAGAPDLRRFQEGLRATHEGALHATLIGHSYGTVVIGYAAREIAGVAADDIVLVASPGVGVNYAADLHGPAYGHVWACTYGFDLIRVVPNGAFGVSPTDWVFGAKQFGLDFDPTLNHTNYWDGDYSSNSVRQSMAAINTGLYGSVR